ncbi:MAG: LysE family translocator [Pseudomonadota bacterium]
MIETLLNMDVWVIVAFMGAAFLLYITPGADMMFTLASGISGGPKAGVAAAAGISMGVLVHVVLAALGLAILLQTSELAFQIVKYAGAAYLLFLAWQNWNDTAETEIGEGSRSTARAFRRGFVTNILNPKVALFVLAFLPQFANPEWGPIWHQIIWLGLFLSMGGVLTDGAFGYFAGLMANKLRASARLMNKVSAIVFGALATKLILDGGK